MADYHIAQINIARILAPIDDPIMADFVAQLPPINALAEESRGFVWRLQSETGHILRYIFVMIFFLTSQARDVRL